MDYRVSDTDLTSVANAIRTKGGTSAGLSFPDGFVSAVQNIPSGGGSTLITKSITANGTYNASSDNADGYSSVTVEIPSRIVIGTFTLSSTDKGSKVDISIPYTGTGYPIACQVFPSGGAYKSGSSAYTSTKRYGVVVYSMVKANVGVAPDYDANEEKNQGYAVAEYKYSSSDSTSYSTGYSKNARVFYSSGASNAHANSVRFTNSTNMSVYVADTSYGLIPEIEYTYQIIYSS